MTESIDWISPPEIGEDRFVLSINRATNPPLAQNRIIVDIDYSSVGTKEVCLPIEYVIQPPTIDGIGYCRGVFTHHIPSSISFTPVTAGKHLVLVKECCHNLWQGRLVIDVGGEIDKSEFLDRQ